MLTSHDDLLWLRHSDDRGKTFTPEQRVNDVPEKRYADGDNRPKILPGPDAQLYITYTQVIGSSWAGNIRLIASHDGGKTFSAPVTVNDNLAPISHRFDASVVGPDGSLWIAWLDKRDQAQAASKGTRYDGAALYYMRYGDTHQREIADSKVLDNACECCRIAISVDTDGTPVVFWRQIYGDNIRDHALARLDAKAATVHAIRATHDDWHIEACPHHGPSLSISSNGIYHMVWYTGAPGREGLYYQHTSDRGRTFSAPVRFGDNDAAAGHPYVASTGHHVVVVWKEFVDDASRIRSIESDDDGTTWSTPATIASTRGASDHPLLIPRNGTIYLSWFTQNEDYRLVALTDPGNAPRSQHVEHVPAQQTTSASIQPFRIDTLPALITRTAPSPTLVTFWSLDCVYCKEDMRVLDAFARRHRDVRLEIVSTDNEGDAGSVKSTLTEYSMDRYENWIFADAIPERVRKAVDPAWHGELPRTYFYVNGVRHQALSGSVSDATLEQWYSSQRASAR